MFIQALFLRDIGPKIPNVPDRNSPSEGAQSPSIFNPSPAGFSTETAPIARETRSSPRLPMGFLGTARPNRSRATHGRLLRTDIRPSIVSDTYKTLLHLAFQARRRSDSVSAGPTLPVNDKQPP